MNKTANATEIRFKEPTKIVVKPRVIVNPIKIVNKIEKIIRKFLKANQSRSPTNAKLNKPE